MRALSKAGRIGAIVLLSFASLWVALACFAQMQSRSLSDIEPYLALNWDPANPRALTRLAERFADAQASAENAQAAIQLAREAIIKAPLDGAAMRVLGIEASRANDPAAAARLMAASDALTQRDSVAQLWILSEAIRRKDFATGLRKSEAVLRRDPGAAPLVYEILGGTLADPAAVSALATRLAARPAWRTAFLQTVAARTPDVDDARGLFAALDARGAPATPEETGALVQRLVAVQRYPEAHALWRARAGGGDAASAGLYAGDFRRHPGGAPFNWRLADLGGAFAELGDGPDGGPALHVQFQTGASADLADQLLILPAGRYRLEGAAWPATDLAARALAWRIECAGTQALVAEQRLDAAAPSGWRPFAIEFDVPPQACAAQRLALRGLAQDRFETVEAWQKGLKLTRLSAGAAPLEAPSAGQAAP